jgi:hypothetical protein
MSHNLVLDFSNPKKLISATQGTYFYRIGNDLFFLIKDSTRTRIEVSKKGFALKYQSESWYPTLQDFSITFKNKYELWKKTGSSYGYDGWTFISNEPFNLVVGTPITPTPTSTTTPTPTPTSTPTATPVPPTATPTPTNTATPTATPVPPTDTPTPTPTSTPTATPVPPTATPTPTNTATPTPTPTVDPSMITAAESASFGIMGVWAMKYKVQNYSGPLWKIRRDSDNTEQDCYSVSDVTTFIGIGNGYVRTWYDQSGQGRNFTETDTTIQPKFIVSDASVSGSIIEFADGKGMSGAYTDSGNSDSTYCVTYTPYKTGTRVLAGSNNWLMGPYFSTYNLYAGAFANGPSVTLNTAAINTAWRASSGNFVLRVNGSAQGGNAGTTSPGTIGLGVRGAFTGSRIQEIIFAKPSATNNTTKVAQIEAKMSPDIPS